MGRAIRTTLRPCLQPNCGHGASAHKYRQVDYRPCRAECEYCDCDGYLDPVMTDANRYGEDGKPITRIEDMPPSRSVICPIRYVAWQWPKPGMRKDGQEGFNNTLFHRSERCPYQASDIVLAAEKAVVQHWGENRAYTYVDPEKIQSANPGYCYKVAGWSFVKLSKSKKPLLEKMLTNGVIQ